MKHLKTVVLAAVAAMALTAFLGAGSASATVLCKTTLTTGCAAAGWDYASGQILHSGETTATILDFWNDTDCKSTLQAQTANTGSASLTVTANIETLSFEECTCEGGSAGSVTLVSKGSLEFHHISGTHEATVTGSGISMTLNCPSLGMQCRFSSVSGGEHIGNLTVGESGEAVLDVYAEFAWASGTGDDGLFICGNPFAWEGTYQLTAPNPLSVAES